MKGRSNTLSICPSLLAMATACIAMPAVAKDGEVTTAWEASRTVDDSDMVTTGVARSRDRLSSATSTSSIKENEINKIAPRSLGELFRNIPGVRVEASGGEGASYYTIRGLPLVNDGAKYLQIQEDGLPVLEFGDLPLLGPDSFIRADLNVAQVDSIRGGSASTFASNAPGGVINLISKTGDVEGGSIMATIGVDYDSYRTDFDYGSQLGNGWRFHIGGFYREGEGPRRNGTTTLRGGQVKLNVTRQFDSGYVRVYGKLLDDKTIGFNGAPLSVSGTNGNPDFSEPAGLDVKSNYFSSPNLPTFLTLNSDGQVDRSKFTDGTRANVKAIGLEAQFQLGEWTVSERFRYADQSQSANQLFPVQILPGALLAPAIGGAGSSLTYAAGPRAGQAFDASSGSGLAGIVVGIKSNSPDVSNMTNDLRLSRVWKVGGGDLTTTAGIYRSSQKLKLSQSFMTILMDFAEGGNSVPLNVTTAGGMPITDGGVLAYGTPASVGSMRDFDVTYQVTAPYGSFNFQTGKFAFGGSVRWDNDRVRGNIINDNDTKTFDMNSDGVLSLPETAIPTVKRGVSFLPVGSTFPVAYNHDYLSYSLSVNFRASDPLAFFARYSLGSRAGADKILFTNAVSTTTGALVDSKAGHDPVRQAEAGVKYRAGGLSLNVTGFYATTHETNSQVKQNPVTNESELVAVSRSYKAYGLELEGAIRRGPFSLNANATLTKAEITAAEDLTIVGNTPRHQPDLIYMVRPQYDTDRFTVGANIVGVTRSYTQDINQLRMPGYTTVGLFGQYRPMDRLELSVNVSNLFDTLAITDVLQGTLPATGVAVGKVLYGRTISTSARFFF